MRLIFVERTERGSFDNQAIAAKEVRRYVLLSQARTYLYVCLIEGVSKIIPNSYAATGN